jgi:hypothetical protein
MSGILRPFLPSDIQLVDNGTIPFDISVLKVVQQASSLADHLKKSSSGMVVLFVRFQVVCQMVDSLCENGNLNFRWTGVAFMQRVLDDDFLFCFSDHNNPPDFWIAISLVAGRSLPETEQMVSFFY